MSQFRHLEFKRFSLRFHKICGLLQICVCVYSYTHTYPNSNPPPNTAAPSLLTYENATTLRFSYDTKFRFNATLDIPPQML